MRVVCMWVQNPLNPLPIFELETLHYFINIKIKSFMEIKVTNQENKDVKVESSKVVSEYLSKLTNDQRNRIIRDGGRMAGGTPPRQPGKVYHLDGTIKAGSNGFNFICLGTQEGEDLSLQSLMGDVNWRSFNLTEDTTEEAYSNDEKIELPVHLVWDSANDGKVWIPKERNVLVAAAILEEGKSFEGLELKPGFQVTFLGQRGRATTSRSTYQFGEVEIRPGCRRVQVTKLWSIEQSADQA